jgi:ABC-type transport system involved in multi-copper enzyme maturation permease subunit
MLTTLIQKELKCIIQSPKFVGSFAVCSVLILLSIFTGIREYQASVRQYDAASQLVSEDLQQATAWDRLSTKTYRAPDPMNIFVSGLNYDIGRWSAISSDEGVKLRHSAYSDDPIFAVFRIVDFAFIVMFVLSLMALQFTFDAVNGERESGTLKLVFSNSVPRARYLFAKCAGSWLGLVVPLGIPILIALLMVIGAGVPLTAGHWMKIGVLLGLSLLLFTVFILLGVFVSAVTRRSSVSFLLALLIWVTFVMIIPRSGVMAAGGLVDVPRASEIEAQREAFTTEKWTDYINSISAACPVSGTYEIKQKQQDSMKLAMEQEIDAYDARLREDYRQRKIRQESMAWSLARLSPASAYQLAAMSLAGTDTDAKARSEDAMSQYRTRFNEYVAAKKAEAGETHGLRITMAMDSDGKSSLKVDASRGQEGINTSDMPPYKAPDISLAEAISPTVIDFGILGFDILFVFAAAFVAFLKYDLR